MMLRSKTLAGTFVFALVACSTTLVACSNTEAVNPESMTPVAVNPPVSGSASCSTPWRVTGSMAQERYIATATSLADGTVIVAGGWAEAGLPAGAERYNSATGAWSAAGSLNVPRYWHRAVGLLDGRVMVVGGFTDTGTTATAEIYNPATNTWSLAAPMSTDRYAPQLTALADGRVLASGGIGGGLPALATAEVYNPVTNTWSPAGSMSSARYLAGAALLSDGRVLVAGGHDGVNYQSSAEIFDPSSGTWSAAPSMVATRYAPGVAVLPDGRAIVVGGSTTPDLPGAEIFDPASGTWTATANMIEVPRYFSETRRLPDGRVLVAGGVGSNGFLAGAEIFDPRTGVWSPVSSLSTARYLATSADLPDGRILVVGGYGDAGVTTGSAETYQACPLPACSEPWRSSGSMATARYNATAVPLADGKVLVAGGSGDTGLVAGAERFDPAAGTWSAAGILNVPRSGHRAVRLQDGRVLVAGGLTDSGFTATVEIYNPATNTWTPAASMSTPRNLPQVTVLSNGRVLAAGGTRADDTGAEVVLASAEVYDPQQDAWSPVGSMGSARSLAGAVLLNDGRVLVAGGRYGRDPDTGSPLVLSAAEIFNPSSGTWSAAASMTAGRYGGGAALLPDGRVIAIGGSVGLPSAEIYNPATNSWSPTRTMTQVPRYFFETIQLSDGRVLVAGGVGDVGFVDWAEIFDPWSGVWVPVSGMATSRYLAVSAELPDGRVLITGGFGLAGFTSTTETYVPCPPNQAPVAVCKQSPMVVSAGPTCTAAVNVDNGSSDPDGPPPLTLSQSPAGPYGLGTRTVTLTASDGFRQGTCSTVVTVKDVTPPQVTCPANQVLECSCPDPQMLDCGGRGGATGTFTATVTDNCSPGGTITCSPSGQTLLRSDTPYTGTCSATDGSGNQTTCNFQVTVADTQPPTAGLPKNFVLWPANSDLVEVSLANCAEFATDSCYGRLHLREWGTITHVTSDERASPAGDIRFHQNPDTHDWWVRLRAQRNGSGDGRVYTIHYKVQPPRGPAVYDSCTVSVPLQSGTTAVRGPAAYCADSPYTPGNSCP